MATGLRDTTFTGTNGDAWTLDSGSWTHVTEVGTWSSGPTENIQSNKGRFSGIASAASTIRRHHADTSFTLLNGEMSVDLVRNIANGFLCGVFMRATGSTGTESFYVAYLTSSGVKSPTYGVTIYKCVAGAYTVLIADADVSGVGTISNTISMKMRVVQTPGGLALIQVKAWVTTEPAWSTPTTLTAGSSLSSADGSLSYVDNTTTISTTAGQCGLITYGTVSGTTYQADWDNFTVDDATAYPMDRATVTVTPQALGVDPGAVSVALSPAEVTVTPQALGTTVGAVSVALTPAAVTITPEALGVTAAAVTAALSPASVTVTAEALGVTSGGATVALTPATIVVTPLELTTAVGAATAALSAATIVVTAVALAVAVPVTGDDITASVALLATMHRARLIVAQQADLAVTHSVEGLKA